MATATDPVLSRQADSGHSPPLIMTLELGGQMFDVAVVGPDYLKLRTGAACNATDGVLYFDIGGIIERQAVLLPEGLRPDVARQAMTPLRETVQTSG
jgi:hypothetical protein